MIRDPSEETRRLFHIKAISHFGGVTEPINNQSHFKYKSREKIIYQFNFPNVPELSNRGGSVPFAKLLHILTNPDCDDVSIYSPCGL